jgi:hypothetical protein
MNHHDCLPHRLIVSFVFKESSYYIAHQMALPEIVRKRMDPGGTPSTRQCAKLQNIFLSLASNLIWPPGDSVLGIPDGKDSAVFSVLFDSSPRMPVERYETDDN